MLSLRGIQYWKFISISLLCVSELIALNEVFVLISIESSVKFVMEKFTGSKENSLFNSRILTYNFRSPITTENLNIFPSLYNTSSSLNTLKKSKAYNSLTCSRAHHLKLKSCSCSQ